MQDLVAMANAIRLTEECRTLKVTALRPIRAKGYFNAKLLLPNAADEEKNEQADKAAVEANAVLIVSDEEQSDAEEPGPQPMATSDPTVLDDVDLLPSIAELPPPPGASASSATAPESAPVTNANAVSSPDEQPAPQQETQPANADGDAIFIDEDDQATPEATPFATAVTQRAPSNASVVSIAIPNSETSFVRDLNRGLTSAVSSPDPALHRESHAPLEPVLESASGEANAASTADESLDYNQWLQTRIIQAHSDGARNDTVAVEPADAPASPSTLVHAGDIAEAPLDEVEVLDEDNDCVPEESASAAAAVEPPPASRSSHAGSSQSRASSRKRRRGHSRSSAPHAEDDEDTMPLVSIARPQTAKRSKPGAVREEDLFEVGSHQSQSPPPSILSDKQLGKKYKKVLGHKLKFDEVVRDKFPRMRNHKYNIILN